MLSYVDYEPGRHGKQSVFSIESGEPVAGLVPLTIRPVTDQAELAAARLDPTMYVVLEEVPLRSRAEMDAERHPDFFTARSHAPSGA